MNIRKQAFRSLPCDKIFDLTEWKPFADNKLNVTQMFTVIKSEDCVVMSSDT